MSLTLEQAKALKRGDILHDKGMGRWKVNGQVKTWKTDPTRVRVPVKHGLYAYGYITEANLTMVTLGEPPRHS